MSSFHKEIKIFPSEHLRSHPLLLLGINKTHNIIEAGLGKPYRRGWADGVKFGIHLCAFQFRFKSRAGHSPGQSFRLTGCALHCADCESKKANEMRMPMHRANTLCCKELKLELDVDVDVDVDTQLKLELLL